MVGLKKILSAWRAKRHARYAAAKANHLTGNWLPANTNVNDLINNASPVVRGRLHQLVRDFPPFARAVNNITQYIVGTGIQFQSRVVDASGKPDKRSRTLIEDAFKRWADDADISGSPAFRQHYYELMGLARRQESETGEFICVFQRHKDPRDNFLPLGLAFYESERLTDLGARPQGKNELSSGVEYDAVTGAIAAFHLSDESGVGNSTRVPAKDVVYGFHRMRPGQIRGITPFAPAVLLAHDLADTMDAEVDAAKLASKWLAMVHTSDPVAFQNARLHPSDKNEDNEPNKPIEYLENAIIEYLRPGEDIKIASHTRGGEPFLGFSKFLLRLVAITVDLPYEILSGDYEKMNFATMRVSRKDFEQQKKPTQARHVYRFCRPVFERVLDEAVLHGRLNLPGYWTNPWHYRRGVFIPPRMDPVDALRDRKADIESIKAGLKSPQEVILEEGRDPDTVLDDIKNWKEMCESRGLVFDLATVSTSNVNNPAAITGEKPGDADARNLRVIK